MNLDNCKYVVWGYKNVYHTHTHIHEAFYRTLKLTGKTVEWLDAADDIRDKDFSNTFFISNSDCINNSYWPWKTPIISSIPLRTDCFYAIHGLNNDAAVSDILRPFKNKLSWNVLTTETWTKNIIPPWFPAPEGRIDLDVEAPFWPKEGNLQFRWATDLIPSEIEANKPKEMLSLKNKVVHYIGTLWWVNEKELAEFRRACIDDGVEFKQTGAGQDGVISHEDNIRMVRESYMAPSISGTHHLTEGYAPCRIFKNISYGQFGITNSKYVNELFENRLIYNPDPYQLYFDAKERLQNMHVSELHELMDFVAAKHTYLNRLDILKKAAQIIIDNG